MTNNVALLSTQKAAVCLIKLHIPCKSTTEIYHLYLVNGTQTNYRFSCVTSLKYDRILTSEQLIKTTDID